MPIDFRFDVGRIFPALEQPLREALVDATEGVRNEMLRIIRSSPASGRIYRRRGVTHQASAPGEPPASDLGGLVRSINTKYDFANYVGTVNVGAKYAAFLEYGTSKMAPRPYARIALSNSRARIKARIEQAVQSATR